MTHILFADFDGVIADYIPDAPAAQRIRRSCVERLNRIVTATGADVVVSSTWREAGHRQCAAWLREAGFVGSVVGVTPVLSGVGARGREIQAWLDWQGLPATKCVILDDVEPMGHLEWRLVRTVTETCLTDADVERVIALMGMRVAA
jgi:hypothetical protein